MDMDDAIRKDHLQKFQTDPAKKMQKEIFQNKKHKQLKIK
jgi:hypothetical protein